MSSLASTLLFAGVLVLQSAAMAGERKGVVSDQVSPLASASEMTRRIYSPTTRDRFDRYLSEKPTELAEHTIDLRMESFDVYVPEHAPVDGYGVLVFVPPSDAWPVPQDWRGVLDALGIIYIAPRRSGNDQHVFNRRMPLALHALELVQSQYKVDAKKRYISGFSGGGRVAMRLAVAYPDVFTGALLMAGSDEIGVRGLVLPEKALADRLLDESRFVFISGGIDLPNRAKDGRVRKNLESLCFRHIAKVDVPKLDHWIPAGRPFRRAMAIMQAHGAPRDEACRTRLNATIQKELDLAEALLTGGDAVAAGQALGRVDDLYGGLAAPRSVELARRIAAALADKR